MSRPESGDAPLLCVEGLTKDFHVYPSPLHLAFHMTLGFGKYPTVRALEDVTFDVRPGERVGVVGRNGAGKSTLLRLLAGGLNATAGRIEARGRMATMLELGTGFHPDVSGRENIRMGGLVIGMSRAEIERKVQSIIDFSELHAFIDMPFRTYSAGMQARLAFSVAVAREPDIFIIDEVLGAGDGHFMAKCIQRITDICDRGTTVLFVSHQPGLIVRFCPRCVWLDKGRVRLDGPAEEVCKQYEVSLHEESVRSLTAAGQGAQDEADRARFGGGEVRVCGFQILGPEGAEATRLSMGRSVEFVIELESRQDLDDVILGINVIRKDGSAALVLVSNSVMQEGGEAISFPISVRCGRNRVTAKIEHLWLGADAYSVTLAVARGRRLDPSYHVGPADYVDVVKRAGGFSVARPGQIFNTQAESPAVWSSGPIDAA